MARPGIRKIKRARQRLRIARKIKDLRQIKDSKNKKEAIYCLLDLAKNYSK